MPTALVLVADGSEEMEAVIAIDVLRRGGVDVTVAGVVGDQIVCCSRKVMLKPDTSLQAVKEKEFDIIVLPGGGPGAKIFAESSQVGELLKKQEKRDAYIGAICAAPTALASHKIASGKNLTSYPVFEDQLSKAGYKYSEDEVVQDGKLITSRGPGTAFQFALKLVQLLADESKMGQISEEMLIRA